uniref:CSON015036 protein n=1 Tax=Culicoides sonorensis TaxID=179676 RepID=A0A336LSK4_CULSO
MGTEKFNNISQEKSMGNMNEDVCVCVVVIISFHSILFYSIDFKNDLSTAVPASLQKSAVLRALEEEERQKKFEPKTEARRESRPRIRKDIDRDTVLKINRRPRHRSADYVWPPRQYEASKPKINEPLRKRSKAPSSSHQNINEIKDIFENHSNRSEPNTLTRLLQRKNTPSIDKNTSSTHNNNENIIDNNNRKMSLSPITTHEMEKTEDEEKIRYKNIHLWPPISSNLNKSSKNWKASTQGQRIPQNDDNNEAITTKTGADDKVVEQIIKQNLYIDKNCDENLCKIECNINFHHDWHGVVPEIRNEESFTDGKRKDKVVPIPPPRTSSKHIDMNRYMAHDIINNIVTGRSSNASPTTSEFTRIYDNIVEPTAYLNISDLESIFSTNTSFSETTTQTTIDTSAMPDFWPPPPSPLPLQQNNNVINNNNFNNQKYHEQQIYNKDNELKIRGQENVIDNKATTFNVQVDFTGNDDHDDNNNVTTVISMDLNNKPNVVTNLNVTNYSYAGNKQTTTITTSDATSAEVDLDCNQQYLFESHCANSEKTTFSHDDPNYFCCNDKNFDIGCQIMTNYEFDANKETTAAQNEIKGHFYDDDDDRDAKSKCKEINQSDHEQTNELVKLAERIKGKCYTDGEYIVIPYDIFIREFGPICANSTENNSQITDNNNSFVDNFNETEKEQSCDDDIKQSKADQLKGHHIDITPKNNNENTHQKANLSSEKLVKYTKDEKSVETSQSCVKFASTIKTTTTDNDHDDDDNSINMNNNNVSCNESKLIKFNDDDNGCYNNSCTRYEIGNVSPAAVDIKTDPKHMKGENPQTDIDNTIKEIFIELNANLQREKSPHPSNQTTTHNIPLIDDIIEDLVLFSQQLLLPRAMQADVIEIVESPPTPDQTKVKRKNSYCSGNNLNVDIDDDDDCEKCSAYDEDATETKLIITRGDEENFSKCDTIKTNVKDNTRVTDKSNNNKSNVINDEEYEKWFYINNTGLAIVLPFVVSVKRVAWPPPPDFSEHQNHTDPSTLTEQLEHHKEHYQHLSDLQNQQQHQLQQKQQQAEHAHPPPPLPKASTTTTSSTTISNYTHEEHHHKVEGLTFHQPHNAPKSNDLNPVLRTELPHPKPNLTQLSPSVTYSSVPFTKSESGTQLKGWKPVKSPVQTLQRTPSGTYTTSVENKTVPPPFELPTVVENSNGFVESNKAVTGFHQAPLYQPQATQAFRPVPAPAQAGYQPFQQKPASPVRPRVVSQSPTNQYPGLITQLRKEAPITQQPSPVFQSQPAAATLRGGSNMRGDQKWPPVETKQQIELENEARRKLAQGPAFRPKRAQKDYTQFFAKNALNNTYPGYRVPPGTQHVGTSE